MNASWPRPRYIFPFILSPYSYYTWNIQEVLVWHFSLQRLMLVGLTPATHLLPRSLAVEQTRPDQTSCFRVILFKDENPFHLKSKPKMAHGRSWPASSSPVARRFEKVGFEHQLRIIPKRGQTSETQNMQSFDSLPFEPRVSSRTS